MSGQRGVTRIAAALVLLGLSGCGYVVGAGYAVISSNDDDADDDIPRPVEALTPSKVQTDRVPIAYVLSGQAGSTFDISVSYSTTGPEGTFQPATEALGSPSEGLTGLTASPTGTPHIFVWNSFFDLDSQGITHSPTIVVRITALTAGTTTAFGAPGETLPLGVDNRLFTTVAAPAAIEAEGVALLSLPVSGPKAAVFDANGNIFISDTGSARIRRADIVPELATTFAGTTSAGYSGDGGPALAAKLLLPRGIAINSAGDLFFADSGNHRIRRVDASTGLISTVAGSGTRGYSGDGGQASSAELDTPTDLHFDSANGLLVADSGNHVIRRISSGVITTVAGTGAAGSGEGPATSTPLSRPSGVCVHPNGTIYIADTGNHAIRQVVSGALSTVAGLPGTSGLGGEEQPPTSSALNAPEGVCLVGDDLVIADTGNHRVRRVTTNASSTPEIRTIAGRLDGLAGFSGDGGSGANSALNSPTSVSANAAGVILISDTGNNRVRQLEASGSITTVVGSGTGGVNNVGDGNPAVLARFTLIGPVMPGANGTLLVADNDGQRIRRFTIGGTIQTIVGTGQSGEQTLGLTGTNTLLDGPRGVAEDENGVVFVGNDSSLLVLNPLTNTVAEASSDFDKIRNLLPLERVGANQFVVLVADTDEHIVKRVQYDYTAATGVVSNVTVDIVAGTAGSAGFSGDGGLATAAELNKPQGLAVDAAGNILIADSNNRVIRRFAFPNPNGAPGNIETIAGTPGTPGSTGDGGSALAATFSFPLGVAVDPTSNHVYVSDRETDRLRRFTVGGNIETVAGTNEPGDGPYGGAGLEASFSDSSGVTHNAADGTILFAARGSGRVLRFDPTTNVVDSIAGAGAVGGAAIGDGGPANQAILNIPNVCVKPDGSVIITDSFHNRLRRIDPRTGLISTFAGNGVAGTQGDGGAAVDALLAPEDKSPTVGPDGSVFFVGADVVRKIDPQGVITSVAGSGVDGFAGDGGLATQAQVNSTRIAVSPTTGALYIGSKNTRVIRRVDPVTGIIQTVAGIPGQKLKSGDLDEGTLASATKLDNPRSLVVGPDETIYFSDGSDRVRKFKVGGVLTTVAGVRDVAGFNGDGILATKAQLDSPSGLALDSQGNLYVCDVDNRRVRKIDQNGFISTVLGNGLIGSGPEGALPVSAQVVTLESIWIDARDNIFVSDEGANRVYRFRNFP